MKRERWGWTRESWAWMLFSIVLVTLAVPLGIVLFDHPLIVLLPLSAARLQSKNLENDPPNRGETRGQPPPGDPGGSTSLTARLAPRC